MTDTNTTPEPPRFKHDCDACKYLGRYDRYDLYFCPKDSWMGAYAQYGDATNDTRNDSGHYAVIEAKRRAIAAGLLPAEPSEAPDLMQQVLADVATERVRQDAKWGVQDHDAFTYLAILTEEVGEAAQAALHNKFGGEARGTLEAELIQVAAVAVAAIERIRRNKETR